MIPRERTQEMICSTLYGSDRQKVGKIGHVFLDNRTEQPAFATVQTGMLGRRENFVPLEGADLTDEQVRVPYDSSRIKDAPAVDSNQEDLTGPQEREIYDYYGLGYGSADASGPGAATGAGTEQTTERDRSDDDAMTRSEERMQVGKESVETGRARLRKYVVTENVERTVPVSREEVRVEREPITEENRDRATAGPAFTESEHEVTLHEERPVTSKEEVPVERVRLIKDTQTEQEQVTDEVRKEQIEEELPENRRNR